jgi:YD repeat-containing protein
LLPTADIPIGTRLYSNGNFGAHYLERTKAGYKVSSWLASDTFDSQGRLAYHEDTPSNSSGKDKLKLYWGEKNTLLAYSDDKGEQMMFIRRNDGGQITGIIDHEGKAVARYKYDDDKLIHSRDVDNHIYIYHYDKNDHMIEVRYTDGSKFVITYDADGRALNNKRIKSGNK